MLCRSGLILLFQSWPTSHNTFGDFFVGKTPNRLIFLKNQAMKNIKTIYGPSPPLPLNYCPQLQSCCHFFSRKVVSTQCLCSLLTFSSKNKAFLFNSLNNLPLFFTFTITFSSRFVISINLLSFSQSNSIISNVLLQMFLFCSFLLFHCFTVS